MARPYRSQVSWHIIRAILSPALLVSCILNLVSELCILNLVSELREQTSRCVACGLCLPTCPTYRKTASENESPRGRIALIRALADGALAPSRRLEAHLALCLTCRACEHACPSEVAYGRIIDEGRALLEQRRNRQPISTRLARWTLDRVLARPENTDAAVKWLHVYQRSGLQRFLRASGLLWLLGLSRLDRLLPRLESGHAWRTMSAAAGERRGRVALFSGCVSGSLDRRTLDAAILVLSEMGYEVHRPRSQRCCGALHRHAGEPDKAAELMRANLSAFAPLEADAVLYSASGCGAMLAEYGELAGNKAGPAFAGRLRDISQFITETPWPAALRLRALPRRVAVHDPCTLRHVLRQQDKVYTLLRKIPGVELIALPGNDICCGGAGLYPVTQADMAQRLLADKLDQLRRLEPDILVTSNIGCALHISAGIRQAKLDIEVIHPIELIARQIQDETDTRYKEQDTRKVTSSQLAEEKGK